MDAFMMAPTFDQLYLPTAFLSLIAFEAANVLITPVPIPIFMANLNELHKGLVLSHAVEWYLKTIQTKQYIQLLYSRLCINYWPYC